MSPFTPTEWSSYSENSSVQTLDVFNKLGSHLFFITESDILLVLLEE